MAHPPSPEAAVAPRRLILHVDMNAPTFWK